MSALISRQAAIDLVNGWFERIGLNGDICLDGLRQLPSATDTNVGTKLGIDPYKIERAIRGLTEWQKHVQTESDIDRDISVAVEALKAQLGTDLASLGTDCISRQSAIDAIDEYMVGKNCATDGTMMARLINELVIKQLPSAQPKIIRCKDCKNWDTTWTNDFSPNYHYCPMVDGVRKEDWFCADAERRTE